MSGNLKIAGVAGWPIHHSLSPLMHTFWLQRAGVRGAYIPFAVRPDEALYAFKTLPKTSLAGMNVTMPLKRLAFEAADMHTADAEKLGVSNCLYVREGKLVAHNTDMEGFAAPLLARLSPSVISSRPCVLIGAGGASRAVIGALLSLGVPEIRLINRTDETAQKLADAIAIPSLYARPWADRHGAMEGAGLIVNSSAAGMKGKGALDLNLDMAPHDAVVYDLVYNPQVTPLLKQAAGKGLQIIGGLDMLIAQARPSFKAFYGIDSPADDPAPLFMQALAK